MAWHKLTQRIERESCLWLPSCFHVLTHTFCLVCHLQVAILQLPIGSEAEFAGVIDLVLMKAIVWQDEELGAKFDVMDLADCDKVRVHFHASFSPL